MSVDSPEVQSAFRAGLGARFTFLADAERRWLPRLGLLEESDTLHEPYRPAAFTLYPDLTITREPVDWAADPFARIFGGTLLRSDLFCAVAPPGGPVVERYAGVAWPGGRFAARCG